MGKAIGNGASTKPVVLEGEVDSNNSSLTPLGIGDVFTGEVTDVLDYGFIFVSVKSDVASAINGLSIEQSPDGVNWDSVDAYSIPANTGKLYAPQPALKYFRIVYTNGATAQAEFRLSTVLKRSSSLPSSHKLDAELSEEDDALLTKSVLAFHNANNQNYENVGIQHPLPIDGDTVYNKDVWLSESNIGNFSGSVTDLFDDLHSVIVDNTANNPKEVLVHFNRTVISNTVGIGANSGDFSNVKIIGVLSGNLEATLYDGSGDSTKLTSLSAQLPVTAGLNAIKIQFHTADTVTLSNLLVIKSRSVVARLQGVKPDGTVVDLNATNGGNFKVSLEEFESGISVNSNTQLKVTSFNSDGVESKISSNGANLTDFDITTPAFDFSGRQRVALPTILGEYKHIHDKNSVSVSEAGTGTGTFISGGSCVEMAVTSGQYLIRQSKTLHPYIAGYTQVFEFTFSDFEPVTGVNKRVGCFSSSFASPYTADIDGIFLETDNNGEHAFKIYKNGTQQGSITRSNWLDKLDGTGASGVTIDFSLFNIVMIDYLWLGGKQARLSFLIGNQVITVATFSASNNLSGVFMSSPDQPVRYEIRSTTGTGQLNMICSSVISDGSEINRFESIGVDSGTSTQNANTVGNVYAVLGVRQRSDRRFSLAKFGQAGLLSLTTDNYRWSIRRNPTVAGTFTYSDVTDSVIQVAKGDTTGNPSTNTVTGGRVVASGEVSQVSRGINIPDRTTDWLGFDIDGTPHEDVLCIEPLSANIDCVGSMIFDQKI